MDASDPDQIYDKQMRINAMSPTKTGVISSPDPRDQQNIQNQTGSPVFDRQNNIRNQNYDKNIPESGRDVLSDSMTNSVGSEDYIPDTDGSFD